LVPRRVLLTQSDELRRENQQLRLQALQGEAALRENDRLRRALGWRQQNRWKMKLAQVIGRDPANWWRTIQIDLGSRDGVKENLPVRTAEGLVGRVGAVGYSRSQVVLVGDPNCQVAVLLQDTRETGVIAPSSTKLDPAIVDLTYLSRNVQMHPGQVVVTSGLGGIFPKGIPLGAVVDSRSAEYGLYTEARVKLFASLTQLEEVWVMFP
ncbi:MAG: rod shape-determining protein MreC, partial [Pedosphaera parvula]|nr:rod shape-determining protein MreC [Pedosphaera parvula]